MNVTNDSPVRLLHGKTEKSSKGYYYVTPRGKQKYRNREETYQQKQSPKQKWNSLAFSEAHKQMLILWADEEQVAQITQAWKDAMHRGPKDRIYEDAKGWKFAFLQEQWKQEHPFEPWYEEYLRAISEEAAQKTEAEEVSDYMLRHQAEILEAQAAALRKQLNASHQK